jgi:hypothetical protein
VAQQSSLSAFHASLQFSNILKSRGLPHAIGGALAQGVWTVPRATMDVDMDVFFTPASDSCKSFLEVIKGNNGKFIDHLNNDKMLTEDEALEKIKRDGSINFFVYGRRFDVFFPKVESETDIVWDLRNCIEHVEIESISYPFLKRDGITLVKLLWKRTKDVTDLEQMFAANSNKLKLAFIEERLKGLCHDDDPSLFLFYKLKKTYCVE